MVLLLCLLGFVVLHCSVFFFPLCRKLTQEEYERQEKEQKLSAADEKAVLAIEEVKVYK